METGIEHDYVMAIVVAAMERPVEAREAYVRHFYSCDARDPALYHLVID